MSCLSALLTSAPQYFRKFPDVESAVSINPSLVFSDKTEDVSGSRSPINAVAIDSSFELGRTMVRKRNHKRKHHKRDPTCLSSTSDHLRCLSEALHAECLKRDDSPSVVRFR
jgi:hypothetical protein